VKSGLPIDVALPEIGAALLSHRAAVLQAPPGAGKSTVVPLALLAEPWAQGRRLLSRAAWRHVPWPRAWRTR
jgi:ATP-dependent helicase HrpB